MAISSIPRALTQAQVLASLTTDSIKWKGGDIDKKLTTLNDLAQAGILNDATPFKGGDIASILAGLGVTAPFIKFMVTQDDVNYNGRVGTWATGVSPASWVGQVLSNSVGHAVNDEICFGQFYVPVSGDYTVYLIYIKDSNHGIAHAMVNDVDKGTLDMYNGGTLPNQLGSISLGTLSSGIKNLSFKVASKNGSSSGHILMFNAVIVVKD